MLLWTPDIMDTTNNIECNNKNTKNQNNYSYVHIIFDIMNTKNDNDNNNNEEKKGNSNGKNERFGNEEDNAIEKKRHTSSKDQVHDNNITPNEYVYALPIESSVAKYVSKYITKPDNDFEMVD